MHAVIVGISDETYDKLVALCRGGIDHSWLATRLLERAVYDEPVPGRCKQCAGEFFQKARQKGRPLVYCSEECRKAGYQERKMRWWRTKGRRWRKGRAGVRSR